MHIRDHFAAAPGTTLSFEFFPPRTLDAARALQATLSELAPLRPSFASVTCGAGGTTSLLTLGAVEDLQRSGVYDSIPHLTCIGRTETDVMALLERYAALGVGNILALRGDLPPGQAGVGGDFAHAADLVRCIKRFNERGLHPDPRGFGIGVACFPEGHPATPNRMVEMDHLKAKVDAGADWLCTQTFFDNHDFHDFRARCDLAGIGVPLLAGILPLTSLAGMKRMAELAAGARFPAHLLRAVQRAGDDPAAFQSIALHHAAAQCHDLINHQVDGVHFYTLNRSEPVLGVLERLGMRSRWQWHLATDCC